MDYRSSPTALAWRDAKTAALYFDTVIPANLVELNRLDKDDPIYYLILRSLLPPSLLQAPTRDNVTGLADPVTTYAAHYNITFPELLGIRKLAGGETLEERRQRSLPGLLAAFDVYVDAAQVRDISVYGETLTPSAQPADGDPSLVLSQLDLVDTGRLAWRHLLEFRKDAASVEKLRALRRFIYKDYQGRSPDFIRDDLQRQLEEHAQTIRFWDFPTRKSIYTIALSSGVSTAAADALGIALFGLPIGTAIVGSLAALGGVAIAVESRRREVELKKKQNPLAYLVEAQRLVADQPAR